MSLDVASSPQIVDAIVLDTPPQVAPRGWLRRAWDGVCWLVEAVIGLVAMIVGLALVAAIPILQLVSLGYLLECSGRMVRERRVSAGFIGLRPAAHLGMIALITWLMLLPLRVVANLAASAQLVAPGAAADQGWKIALFMLTILGIVHWVSAVLRGGRLRDFCWPAPVRTVKLWCSLLTFGTAYHNAVDALYRTCVDLRLGYFFRLGLRGFIGSLAWLVLPVALLAAGRNAPVLGVLGAILLTIVVLYLPFLQTRFAAENRWRALFQVREVRRRFMRAPWAYLFALLFTLALSLPLNLLKIEHVPREAAWLPSLFFVAFGLPARWFTGWALLRAERRTEPRWWLWRWLNRGLMLPVAAAYVLFMYGTQFTSWHGIGSLYEQHAFLLPVPFLGN